MKLMICAVGRLKAGPERDLFERYRGRLEAAGRSLALGPVSVVDVEESRARRAEDRKAEESGRLGTLAGEARLVVLDEGGSLLTSGAFARRIGQWRDEGAPALAFLIGGADGHGAALPARAALTLSLGRMTFPHQIVRILLAEQLYRAATILAGHPYHRE